MLNSEQTQYIDSLRVGYPNLADDTLKQTLSGAGWSEDEIKEALARYKEAPAVATATQQGAMPTSSATSTKPTAEAQHEPSKKSHISHTLSVTLAVILLCVTLGASGYYVLTKTSLLGFGMQTFTNETLLPHIFKKLAEINTASYELGAHFTVGPRDVGAEPFGAGEEISPEELAKYQRDYDRLRDVASIKNALDQYGGDTYYDSSYYAEEYQEPVPYPKTLTEITDRLTDPLGKPYVYTPTADRSGYTIEVTFETIEAAETISYGGYYGVDSDTESGRTVTITESDYVSTYGFTGEPAKPKLFGLFDLAEIEGMIPADLSVSFAIGGTADASTDAPVNGKLQVRGDAAFGDANFAFDAEGIKKENRYYGVIHKMPAFFSSMSSLKEKWFMLTEEDLRNYGYGMYLDELVPSSESEQKKMMENLREQFNVLLNLAIKHGIVVISGEPVREKKDGVMLTKYQLAIVAEKLLPFYEEAADALKNYDEPLLFRDEATIEYLKSESFTKTFAYFKEHAQFSLWLDKKGFPVRSELSIRYIPTEDATALKDKQLNLSFVSTYSNINEPITVEEPANALSFDDLMSEVTGMSKEEILLERQQSNVETLRNALDQYYYWSGTYPNSLSELKRTRSEVPQMTDEDMITMEDSDPNAAYNMGYAAYGADTEPFLSMIPLDVYSKSPYRYSVTGDTYELRYEIKLPPYTKESDPSLYYTYDYSYDYGYGWDDEYYSEEEPEEQLTLYLLKFSNGDNIATPAYLSQAQQDRKDTDFDGLVDALEQLLGTNLSEGDTDDDGFNDAEEITTESNPLGPGMLEVRRNSGLFF